MENSTHVFYYSQVQYEMTHEFDEDKGDREPLFKGEKYSEMKVIGKKSNFSDAVVVGHGNRSDITWRVR